MAKRMLIDATHPEETRVTVVSGNRLEEFDYETETRRQLKGNIYLAKVTRVEPSLQAAFVEYGGNRHGFLAFSEIHPDYYRIPVGDREELVEDDQVEDDDADETETDKPVEELGGDEGVEEAEEAVQRRPRLKRQYKIQEVIKRRQVLLVQVVKEERGNKGAALTTYLSLAGRYCVLMPNTSRGGGVSRKIVNPTDRKRLKKILAELTMPQGMAVIVRTAGAERSRAEIKRDFDYIFKLWDDIRTRTLEATAPTLIHEEANLIKRALRDLYAKDMEEILVSGDEGYRTAKNFMKSLIPSHAKKVQPYRDNQGIPLFQRYQVESQLAAIHEPTVMLRSGGSIVIHQTEALVSIDVNSGKATRERHIEETALKTNLEAAEEIARQLRLRDMAGLIVIDFIDMEDNRNDQSVERKLKETLKKDRARIQVGRISPFGLLEMSRQRLRPSILEAITQSCPHCGGTGYIQSTESAALSVLRAIEEEGLRRRSSSITVTVNPDVALYILNNKRSVLGDMETNYEFEVTILTKHDLLPAQFEMTRVEGGDGSVVQVTEQAQTAASPQDDDQQESRGRKRRRRRRGKKRPEDQDQAQAGQENQQEESDQQQQSAEAGDGASGEEEGQKKRRKRGRRGGRRRGRGNREQDQNLADENQSGETTETDGADEPRGEQTADNSVEAASEAGAEDSKPKRPRRRRGRKSGDQESGNQEASQDNSGDQTPAVASEGPVDAATSDASSDETPTKPKHARRSRKKKEEETVEASSSDAPVANDARIEEKTEAPVETSAEIPESGDAAEAKPAKKARAKKARAKKAGAKKTTAKKASAKKTRAKKASAKSAEPKEAPAAPEAVPSPAPAAVTPAPASPAPTPSAPAQPAAVSAEPVREENPNQPKRKGWWSRVLGS